MPDTPAQPFSSRIYRGWVRHRRFAPTEHAFKYPVFMLYLRLDEIDELLGKSRLFSAERRALGEFRRSDFFGDPELSLDESVRNFIAERSGSRHRGPIYVLCNLRYLGYSINPICCYYCFDESETKLEYLLAEVTNTPWNERHQYLLAGPREGHWLRSNFAKAFHVSPFHPMDLDYDWRSNTPGKRLSIHMALEREGGKVFDASLALRGEPATPAALDKLLLQTPWMTAKVAAGIYWQALRLWFKRTPFYTHPDKQLSGA